MTTMREMWGGHRGMEAVAMRTDTGVRHLGGVRRCRLRMGWREAGLG